MRLLVGTATALVLASVLAWSGPSRPGLVVDSGDSRVEASVNLAAAQDASDGSAETTPETLADVGPSVWHVVIDGGLAGWARLENHVGEAVTLEINEFGIVVNIPCEARNFNVADVGFTPGTIQGGGCGPTLADSGPLGTLAFWLGGNPGAVMDLTA